MCRRAARILSLVMLVGISPMATAGDIAFPWQSSSSIPVGRIPARVLPKPPTTPIEVLPPSRQAYPYGWFGPNPTPQWKRSFGTSKGYTQWSRL